MTGIHRSPGMRSVAPYPFEELDRRAAQARRRGRELIDFGVGDPREETPAFIREAPRRCARARVELPAGRRVCRSSATPSRHGSSDGSRRARGSRHGGPADPRVEGDRVLARAARARSARGQGRGDRDRAGVSDPRARARASPVARSCERRSAEDRTFLPDLDRVPEDVWSRAAILWINYPNNPTGAIAPRGVPRGGRRAVPRRTTCCSPRMRRTPSCGSARARRPACSSSPTGRTCSRSTRCRSARR